jgi:hypothetical protein
MEKEVVDYKIFERNNSTEFWVNKVVGEYLYEYDKPFPTLQEARNWILMNSPEGSYMV